MRMDYRSNGILLEVEKNVTFIRSNLYDPKFIRSLYDKFYTDGFQGILFKNIEDKDEDIFKYVKWMFNRAEWKNDIAMYYVIKGRTINQCCGTTEENGCPNDSVYIMFPLDEIEDCEQVCLDFDDRWNGFDNACLFTEFISEMEDIALGI